MKKSYTKYIVSLLLFGSNGIIASNIGLDSCKIVLLRCLIGSLFLVAIFFLTKQKLTLISYKKDAMFIIVSGIATGASWMFLYEAYVQIGVGISSLLYYCGPVIVMILSPIIFKEKLTLTKIFGFAVVVLGVLLVNGQGMNNNSNYFGLICGAMSAILYALMVIFNKKSTQIPRMESSVLQIVTSFLTVGLFLIFKGDIGLQISGTDWPWILLLGLVNTGIGCYLYFSSIGSLPVQTVAICGYLEPLSAVILSVILLSESMVGIQIVGAVLIISGAIFGELFNFKDKCSLEKCKNKLAYCFIKTH